MKKRLYGILVSAICAAWLVALPCRAAYPSWWTSRNVITNTASTNDYAAANLGQLKWFATNACDELEANLPGGAGTSLWTMVGNFSASSNYVAINVGQLKSVARPVYDRLIAEGYTNGYPWTGTTTDDVNYAAANLGQVKNVFSFDLAIDGDSDALPDWWERHWWGNTNSNCGTNNADGDSWTNYTEYLCGLCPTNAESAAGDEDNDGYLNVYEVQHSNHCNFAEEYPAPTFYVCSTGSHTAPYSTWATAATNIQAALNLAATNASNYDIILVANGTYTGSGNRELDFGGTTNLLISEGGAADCILDCEDAGRGFCFDAEETASAAVVGFTIRNGNATDGGGIMCDDASPSVRSCIITACTAGDEGGGIRCKDGASPIIWGCTIRENLATNDGGGIYCTSASTAPWIENCTIAENVSDGDGGGIACEDASPVVTNSTITGNISFDNGGGIFCTNSAIAIQDCLICSNTAADHGGGVYWQGSSSAVIRDCTLEENSAVDGGGIGLKTSDATVDGCTIRNNTANEDGGGIRCKECSPLIVNCKVVENMAWKDGGGIECTTNAAPRILQCTVADNESAESGGGLYANYSCPTSYNCIYWGNSATNDGEQIGWTAAGSTVTVEWCDIESWTNGGAGNTNAEPLLVPGNYRLKADSPCIDAGVSNAMTAAVPLDIENQARWDDPGHTTVTSRWDMGCYEFVDGDADEMDDWWEVLYLGGTNAAATNDLDSDGVTNLTEYALGTNPGTNDTDGDGLTDAEEGALGTNPQKADTDGDGMKDGYEVAYGFSATNKLDALEDKDTDGVLNGIEAVSGTCPTNSADPAATNKVSVQFQIGDASGTSSEVYTACVDLVPVLTSTNGQGVLSTNIMLVRGCEYTVMKRHRPGIAGIFDCDYTWKIAGKGVRIATNDPVDLPGDTWFTIASGVLIHDPMETLGNYDAPGSSTPPYPCTRVKVYVVDAGTLSLTNSLSGRGVEDVTWADEAMAASNTIYLAEGSNGTAQMNARLDWAPASLGASWFRWKVELTNGDATAQWTPNDCNFATNPVSLTWTNLASGESNREFRVTGWFDIDTNQTFDVSEQHRRAYAVVVDTPWLKLSNAVSGDTVTDQTWTNEVRSTTNTLYLAETTNGNAQMTMQFNWLPANVNSNWFRWKIVLTNGSETAQWSPTNSASFTTNPVTVTWTNMPTSGPTSREFRVDAWFDVNTNGTQEAWETHRQAFVTVFKLELHPRVSDFAPGKEGRVMISTMQDDVYHTSNSTTKANTAAQTNDHQVAITVHVIPTFAGAGRTVYFRTVDPDADDLSSYETNSATGDNRDPVVGAGTFLGASNAVVELCTMNGQQVAAAEVTLAFTDRYAGDNYQVQCSLWSNFPAICDTSAVMVAWKRIYVEEDQMYRVGSDLSTDCGGGTNVVDVTDASVFATNDTIVVFDADHPSGETAQITNILGNTLYLNSVLANSYNAGYASGDRGAAVARTSSGTYNPDRSRFLDGYGDSTSGTDGGSFVEHVALTNGAGNVPYKEAFGSYDARVEFRNVWFSNTGKTNVTFLCGARYCNVAGDGIWGIAHSGQNYCYVCIGEIEDDLPTGVDAVANADTTVHELGHQFTLNAGDFNHVDLGPGDPGYSATANHVGTDLCVMDYGADPTNAATEFCTNCIYKIRDLTDGL